MENEKLVMEEDAPVDYTKISPFYLEQMLDDELSLDDIKEFQTTIFSSLKRVFEDNCDKHYCKLVDDLLKEMIIVRKLIDWIIILEKERGL